MKQPPKKKDPSLLTASASPVPVRSPENEVVPSGPVAPLWDLPDNPGGPLRVLVRDLSATLVYRVEHDAKEPVFLGTVGPQCTHDDLQRRWGGGRYFIQARVNGALKFGHYLTLEGNGKSRGLFPPVMESPSGLISITEHDPVSALVYSICQQENARVREDSGNMLTFMHSIMQTQAEQMSSTKMVTFLDSQLREALKRVAELEGRNGELIKLLHEKEINDAKRGKKESQWMTLGKAAMEQLPAMAEKFPGVVDTLMKAAGMSELAPHFESAGSLAPSLKRTVDTTQVILKGAMGNGAGS